MLVAGALFFIATNIAVFATPLYRGIVSPASTTGSFEYGLDRVDRLSKDARRDILVLGDSRIFAGFEASAADRAARGFRFLNAGIPGTTPRCWAVFDRALDAGGDRYRAVVVPLDSYGDDDGAIGSVDGNDRALDLHYIVLRASWRDVWMVATSFSTLEGRLGALFDLLLRGPLLREDLQAFVGNPRERAAELHAAAVDEPHVRFAPFSDAYFGSVAAHPGAPAAWGGALAFGLQIYFDFSGYSDIAIGSARVLGFAFPENFRRPYLAWSTEFWRRWHISLSHWLRDYLYVPLGGSRQSPSLTVRNLMITMLLGGLWHGASWTFVAWGGYHGALLSLERRVASRMPRFPATLVTFVLVLFGWVLFRAQSFSDAFDVAREMIAGKMGPALFAPLLLVPVAFALACEVVIEMQLLSIENVPLALRAASVAALLLALECATYPGAAAQFVYFKF